MRSIAIKFSQWRRKATHLAAGELAKPGDHFSNARQAKSRWSTRCWLLFA